MSLDGRGPEYTGIVVVGVVVVSTGMGVDVISTKDVSTGVSSLPQAAKAATTDKAHATEIILLIFFTVKASVNNLPLIIYYFSILQIFLYRFLIRRQKIESFVIFPSSVDMHI